MKSKANYCFKYLKNDRTIRRIYKKSKKESITKKESKTEFKNRRLRTQGKKEVWLNRISKAIQDMDSKNTESESRNEANKMERYNSNTSDTNISIELVKEIFTNMFREQAEKLSNIVRNGISDTNVCLDW